ncbi:MAG TPA: hydroxyacid dehydrogenase [Quisquiliibacterium sp.]|nr:hydroxyacid dehydrogenase [Quisquiliibacterium sp.]HQN10510.1 hydroxyacid dehydrogenase [Quisquiliibacterium sp.]HQP65660.1 hydroxyacid dehydrogenase [Quisquiliibacterium sp.]
MSAAPVARVVRFDSWVNPVFDERLRAEAGIELQVHPMPSSQAAAEAALKGAHVYHVSAAKDEIPPFAFVTPELIAACPTLLCASSTGAGFDPIDVAACTRAGIAVVNQSGGNAVSVAEHTLGLILSVTHRIAESDRRLRTERGFSREDLTGREIAGKTIGLVGIGNIGRRVAALAHAFGLQVLAVDPNLSSDEIRLRGAEPVSLDTLLERSDFVSLHCPRDATTRGMIDAAAFARMKPGSVFISTARGGIHDERGLHQAIVSGRVAGAGLDVWDQEPPPLDHPLLACDTVVATYHTAGVTHEARRNMAAISADQLVRLLRGERPPRLINPEVWPAYVKRFETILQRPVVDHG